MADRNDVNAQITEVDPQDFAHGKIVIKKFPVSYGLEKGDVIRWTSGQHFGKAKIVSCGVIGNFLDCTLQRTS